MAKTKSAAARAEKSSTKLKDVIGRRNLLAGRGREAWLVAKA